MWAKAGYPSLKPLASWFTDLVSRVEFMRAWLVDGTPKSFWISGMFFPQGFMTGCLQTHARHHKIAIDRLDFSFQIMTEETADEVEEMPEDGVYVHGFYMDGARFNREEGVIDDQHPVSAKLLPNATLILEPTLLPNASDLAEASDGLRAQRRRVRLPLLQDWQARGSPLNYGSVDELHHPRGRPLQC